MQQHVSPDGVVDYRGFIRDRVALRAYLDLLAAHPPERKTWTDDERKAYWINAYNAFTVDIVTRNYPVASIKDIGPALSIPFVNSVWDIKFIRIGEERLDLNNIEHRKLRKGFGDARIHFAIVCASASCPRLRNEAFVAERLDQQLDAQARAFINDEFRNRIRPNELELSKIFSWFKGDFTQETDLIGYLQAYTEIELNPRAKIASKKYDWGLNE
ncbi:MAG: DUF547 domain-containing protein [Bacteroidota bacterium]